MKKQLIGLVILLWAVGQGLVYSEYQNPRLYIKFNGIGSIAAGGDFGNFIDRNETYFTGLNSNAAYNISFTSPSFFRGFSGEIGIDAAKYAVGISMGYLEKKFHIDYSFVNGTTGYEDHYTREHTFSALPIFLFIHYKIINTRALTTYFTLGEGVYLARYRDKRSETFQNYSLTYTNSLVESKKNRLGFHVGVTIDLNIAKFLALSLEGAYRLTSFKEMIAKSYYEDDNQQVTAEGDFYYWINNRTGQGRFDVGPPDDKVFWDGLPAQLNLNGFSFSVGLKITFGSKKRSKPAKAASPEES